MRSILAHICHTFTSTVYDIYCRLGVFLDKVGGTWPNTAATERQPDDGEDDEDDDVGCQNQDGLCFELGVGIIEEDVFDFLGRKVIILVDIAVAALDIALGVCKVGIGANGDPVGVST